MPSDRENMENMPLEQLADCMQRGPATSPQFYPAAAELERRKAEWLLNATEAQQQAAAAAKETAEYTERNAHYLLLSVWVLTVASILNLIVSVVGLFWQH